MTERPNPEDRPDGPKCHHTRLRVSLIDALALAAAGYAVFHYRVEDPLGSLIVFVGAYTLAGLLHGANWTSFGAICETLLMVLAPLIHLGTLVTAPASFTGLVFTFLLPGVAQAYWLWELWPATSTLSHPLTLMCAVWLALLGVAIIIRAIRPSKAFRGRTPSNENTRLV